ncbi:MAG: twin-arginine translocase TatA/TatE family subunit [Alphaproteobacteria bacterium]|nr:twin-arginine translocase TatA/TatE family subunit [Alphaproteobacteria bacterium]
MRAGFWEILLIVILVLILFGHAKIPDLMKNLANGINVFKKELKGSDQKTKSEKKPVEKKKTVSNKKTVKKTAKK